jgi:hypothetical protein
MRRIRGGRGGGDERGNADDRDREEAAHAGILGRG